MHTKKWLYTRHEFLLEEPLEQLERNYKVEMS